MPHPILSSFLNEKSLQVFLKTWPEQCVYTHGSTTRLPAVFNNKVLASSDRLTRAFRGEFMECDARIDSKMKPVCGETADAVIRRGATAYLGDIAPLLDGIDDFLAQLELELGISAGTTRIGAFVSPPGNGASCHYDVLDVISIQLIGSKRFNISPVNEVKFPYGYQYNPDMPPFDDLYPQISTGFPHYSKQTFKRIDMRPGSVLCIPRGTWHHTQADSDSLALSIALNPPTEADRLLRQLAATLLQSEAWRSPCYDLGSKNRANYDELPAVIDRLIQREKNPNAASKCFGADTRYIRDPSVQLGFKKKAAHYEITIKGNPGNSEATTARMEVPEQTVAVFKWLIEQNGPFTVRRVMEAFPSLPLDYFRQIFEVASKTGMARYLWFDPLN